MGTYSYPVFGALIMVIEWLLMGVLYSGHGGTVAPVQQVYSTQAECEAARKVWDSLTPSNSVWVDSTCVKKVKT